MLLTEHHSSGNSLNKQQKQHLMNKQPQYNSYTIIPYSQAKSGRHSSTAP